MAMIVVMPQGVMAKSGFEKWIEEFYPVAQKEGIQKSTYEIAFAGITEPDARVLEKAAYQPEFKTKIWDYVDARVNSLSIKEGMRMDKYYSRTLDSVVKKFGIQRSVLLAIWSMESNFGNVLKRPERLHYVPRALATLAYKDDRRKKFARSQLIASLKILQDGDVDKDQLTGSWAGAMGHTQFIPTSYLAYGVDMDGNGRRDIWNSIPDALATAANLLHKNGWRPGKTWGYEVELPNNKGGVARYEGETKLLSEWQELGFKRPHTKGYPRPGEKAVFKLLAGENGPGFLMMKNFFVLKRYNNADAYALGVGLLADRIAGFDGMVQSWPRPPGSLSFDAKFEVQRLLKKQGHYHGKIDGYLGKGTRTAIKSYQEREGLKVDGEPNQNLLKNLQQ
ncbi:MAG: lytic murein transglycosylase [Desulfobulbaceae bacterium]|nr:lytic murein transglycosylase [Desulfobulbaceae bacterium]